MTEPTALDVANAAARRAIADRFRHQYEQARALTDRVLGPGWTPTGYHYLVEKDAEDAARRTNTKPAPSATVITAQRDGRKRHFRVETMIECDTPEAGFGDMLMEPHPTKGFEHRGRWCRTHRHSLCYGWYEPGYAPQTAEQLAAARAKREAKAVETEAEGNLFADQVMAEGYVPKKRTR